MNKKNIPTHDPQTGELNPYYEDLTGEPNPLVLHQLDAEQQKTYLEFYNEEYDEKRKAEEKNKNV
jgi:hypothetical protein|tara:strand:+ start:784 stop:978 length:195 start_codon:yes stop_codon:yes gene_type:complete